RTSQHDVPVRGVDACYAVGRLHPAGGVSQSGGFCAGTVGSSIVNVISVSSGTSTVVEDWVVETQPCQALSSGMPSATFCAMHASSYAVAQTTLSTRPRWYPLVTDGPSRIVPSSCSNLKVPSLST